MPIESVISQNTQPIKGRKRSVLDFFDIIAFLVFIAGIAAIIRFFVFMPYTVEGSSMADTFHNRDFILVEKITPKFGTLQRGDVVVFIPPGKDIPFIKRIVGLPGETVKIYGGKVYICTTPQNTDSNTEPGTNTNTNTITNTITNPTTSNDCFELKEPYLTTNDGTVTTTEARCGITSFDVKDGYFVMGDNRGFSTDSRCCFGLGCSTGTTSTVGDDRIIGKVFARILPTLTSFGKQYLLYK